MSAAGPEAPRWRGRRLWVAAGLLLLVAIWGTQFLIIKVGQRDIPPLLSMALRYAIVFVVAGGAAWLRRERAPTATVYPRLLFGLLQAVSMGLLYWSQGHLPSSLAAIINMSEPFFVLLLAHWWVPGERLRHNVVVAQACGFAGLCVIIVGRGTTGPASVTGLGPLVAVLMSAAVAAGNRVLGKRLVRDVPPLLMMRDVGLVVALSAAAASWRLEDHSTLVFSGAGIVAFIYLGLVASTLASTLYLYLLRRLPVSSLSYLQFVTALTAVAVGTVLVGERLPASSLVGVALVLVGLWLVARRKSKGLDLNKPVISVEEEPGRLRS